MNNWVRAATSDFFLINESNTLLFDYVWMTCDKKNK